MESSIYNVIESDNIMITNRFQNMANELNELSSHILLLSWIKKVIVMS